MKTFFIFWSSPSNLRAKSVLKQNDMKFGAKYSPDCCRIPNASDPRCVCVPSKVFVPPETHYSGAAPVTILFYLQCRNYTDTQQIILFCPTKCQHFGKISRKTVFAIWKFSHIAIKSFLFVLLNTSISEIYRKKNV